MSSFKNLCAEPGKSLVPAAVVILLLAASVYSQSGRRSKPGSTPTPTSSITDSAEKKSDAQNQTRLVVGIYNHDPLSRIPAYMYDTVLDLCVRRLSQASAVMVTSAGNNIDKAAAIQRARDEEGRYVIWLDLEPEVVKSGNNARNSPSDLLLNYTILEPRTGKVKRAGASHLQIHKPGQGGVLNPTRTSPAYTEQALKQAAFDVAEQVLATFGIKLHE